MIDPEQVIRSTVRTHGRIGQEYIFQTEKDKKYYRIYTEPDNPKTVDQQVRRSLFHSAVRRWHHLTPGEKEEWREKAKNPWVAKTGNNLFIESILKEGIEVAVKKILSGVVDCSDGNTNITIEEVDPTRCLIFSPDSEIALYDGSTIKKWGAKSWSLTSSTNLRVNCNVPSGMPVVNFNYQIVEFV
jgi:hypothetical protein